MGRCLRRLLFGAGLTVGMLLISHDMLAHRPIMSKYTYTEDVFPILNQRCGRCHVTGGVAPMSLMTYRDAVPWAESIRAELVLGHMPPAYADRGYGAIRDVQTLSPRELDTLLVWAIGGTPQGPVRTLPAVSLKNDWALGPPDLVLPMSAPFTLAAGTIEETAAFVLPNPASANRWVRAVDLLPGNPAIVRHAVISVRPAPGRIARAAESSAAELPASRVLAVWVPGHDPAATSGASFLWPGGADLELRIRYRKTWKYEGSAATDRSAVGIYFADRPSGREVRSLLLEAPSGKATAGTGTVTFTRVLTRSLDVLAVRPEIDRSNVMVQVTAVRRDGSRVPMVRFVTRTGWERRYWFVRPLSLPAGTKIEVTATLKDVDETQMGVPARPLSSGEGGIPSVDSRGSLRLWADVATPPRRAAR